MGTIAATHNGQSVSVDSVENVDRRGERGEHIPELDGLRAVAIGLVMFRHITGNGSGWIGVDLFFVLSGFLITGICLDHQGPGFFKAFYARRVLRIVPPYAVALLVIIASSAAVTGRLPSGVGWMATFTTNIGMAVAGTAYVVPSHALHLWSLAVEEQFYLVWPLLLLLLPVRRVATIAIPLALAIRVGLLASQVSMVIVQTATVARMDAFAIGGLLAVAYRAKSLPTIGGDVRAWAVGLLAVSLGLSWLGGQGAPLVTAGGYTVVAVLAGALIVAAITSDPRSSLRVMLRHPVMRAIGARSYAMYLFHVHVLWALGPKPTSALGWILYVVAGCGLTYAVAVMSWRFVEAPALALKRRFRYA